jgi:acyl-coenzyme A thioesterase PaaI-like protein
MTPEAPEEGLTPLTGLEQVSQTFVSGPQNADRIRIRYFSRDRDGALVGRVQFGPQAEGPPGAAHGGAMAAVLDEAMGFACWLSGRPVVAARIEVEFNRPLPLGLEARLEAWVEAVDGRKVTTRARLHGEDGLAYSQGSGVYVQLDVSQLGV